MRLLRLFIFWLLAFAVSYGINILAVLVWKVLGNNNFILTVGMMNAPLACLFFGWLYFRPGFAVKLSTRIKNAIVWIALDFVGVALVLSLLSRFNYSDMFSPAALIIEMTNFLALLLAGYLCLQPKPRSASALPRSSGPPRPGQA